MIVSRKNLPQSTDCNTGEGSCAGSWGTVLLLTGVALCGLTYLNHSGLLPFSLPRTWFIHRFAWYAIGLLTFFGGCFLLRMPQQESETSSDKLQQSQFKSLILYSRKECHLCDDAKTLLLKYQSALPEIIEVNIDNNAELQEKFSTCVPVVEIDGKVRFRGQIDELLLRRLLDNQ